MTQAYLAKDRFNHAIQVLKPGITVVVTVSAGGSNRQATALSGNCNVVRLLATVDTYTSVGNSDTVAATSISMYLPALNAEYFRVDEASTSVTALSWAGQGVSGAGLLYITEMV